MPLSDYLPELPNTAEPSTFASKADAFFQALGDLEAAELLSIVGAVSQDAGAPTGAVMERGVNSNGRYTKFASGLMVCHHELTLGATQTALGGVFASSGPTTWNFPATFADPAEVPVAMFGADTNVGGGLVVSCFVSNGAAGTARAIRWTSSAVAPIVRLGAIGFWFEPA